MSVPLRRPLLLWILLMAVEIVHGIVRRIVLIPLIGDLPSRQVGVLIGSALILVITIACFRWLGVTSTRALFVIGALWAALTLGFEVMFGFASGASAQRIASDYDIRHGGLMPLGLALELLSPFIASRVRSARRQPSDR